MPDMSDELRLPRPSPAQLAWQDAELGLVYHYDLHIFDDCRYRQDANRRTVFDDPDIFNPRQLDTDQWIDAARAAGARFAIITASHETGFRLWRSEVNPFSVANVRWGGGKRDVVGEFVESCRSAGIRPGVYMGTRWNGRLGVWDFRVTQRSPLTQEEYNRLIETEVEEICTRYGELFELWFDGGAFGRDAGGPDVLSVFERHQPGCLFYHSHERADARWGGTETGTVGYPCWATLPFPSPSAAGISDERHDLLRHGDPDGEHWCPAMSDAPLRDHEWFWEPGDEEKLFSPDELFEMYCRSVGRNSTLILGAAPDSRGLMPDADVALLQRFGEEVDRRFGSRLARTAGRGPELELELPRAAEIAHVILQEDIAHGERVRAYDLDVRTPDGAWRTIASGTCIGHKRIERLEPITATAVRLRIGASTAGPIIRELAVC